MQTHLTETGLAQSQLPQLHEPRNQVMPLDLRWVASVQANTSAIERRAATLPGRRSVKKDYQAAWLCKAVSLIDLTFTPGRDTSVKEVNKLLKAASESGPLKGILAYTDEPFVSIDFNGDPASSTIDSLETTVLEGKLVRVVSWYDNEWGFSNRMVDTAGAMAKLA